MYILGLISCVTDKLLKSYFSSVYQLISIPTHAYARTHRSNLLSKPTTVQMRVNIGTHNF